MNNNSMGRVAVRTSSRKRVPTPLPFDVNATCGVGSILPLMVREMPAKSGISVKTRNLIRLATMNVPTYGRLKLNLRHYFVGMSDLTKNFAALLAEQVISRAHGNFKPTYMPYAHKGFLSLLSLVGAHVTLYRNPSSSGDTVGVSQANLFKVNYSASSVDPNYIYPQDLFKANSYQNITGTVDKAALNDGEFYKTQMPTAWRDAWNGYDGPCLNIAKLITSGSLWPATSAFWIPIENKDWTTFFDIVGGDPVPDYYNTTPVPLGGKGADAVISIDPKQGSVDCFLACRFSSFGQRWFNLVLSSGLGIDYGDTSNAGLRSLMPLFAYYKAYWESFGLTLHKKWETSPICKMLCVYDDLNEFDFESNIAITARYANGESVNIGSVPSSFYEWFCNFVCDVGTAFYTEEQDFTSIHTRTPTVSSDASFPYMALTSGVSLDSGVSANVSTSSEPSSVSGNTGHNYLATVNISQLDIETLKRMYKVVNRNTIAGQNIAKILEMQGLGDYVASCKSRFIGEFEVPIDIDEVTATADAFDSNGDPRSLLGEQGAKGVGFGSSGRFKVSAPEFGYYICLGSIVPEAGYCNLVSSQALNLKKTDFYNPEFDGLGMELNTKELCVSGQVDWSDSVSSDKLSGSSFGFAPRYSRHKVQHNVALGGFALRSERSYYRSYFMDKVIDVGERVVSLLGEDNKWTQYTVQKLIPVSKVPTGSPNWRYVGRYPWIENYLRIFAETGDPKRMSPAFFASLSGFDSTFFDFTFRDEDKFIVQNRFLVSLSAPWLKITDSFETKEDGNVGSTDVSIGKA